MNQDEASIQNRGDSPEAPDQFLLSGMNPVVRRANRALEGRGYLVLAWRPGPLPVPKVGDVLDEMDGIPGPLFVTAATDAKDWVEQIEQYGSDWMRPLIPELLSACTHYFRLVAE